MWLSRHAKERVKRSKRTRVRHQDPRCPPSWTCFEHSAPPVLPCLTILSQNAQGLTQDKEDILLELMDRLHLDLVFREETWKQPPQGSSESKAQFISRAGCSIIEYTNSNQRRGIQFRVAARLEPFLHHERCHKLPFVEILTIQVYDMVFEGTYTPDGRTLVGIQQWITTMDTLEASFPNKAVVALGDLNCRVRTLGHSRLNESGPILDI